MPRWTRSVRTRGSITTYCLTDALSPSLRLCAVCAVPIPALYSRYRRTDGSIGFARGDSDGRLLQVSCTRCSKQRGGEKRNRGREREGERATLAHTFSAPCLCRFTGLSQQTLAHRLRYIVHGIEPPYSGETFSFHLPSLCLSR